MNNRQFCTNKGRGSLSAVSTFFFCLLLILTSCRKSEPAVEYVLPDSVQLHSGDLVFRKGISTESHAVMALDRKSDYTHVGMVMWDRGQWRVLHAVPSERATEQEEDSVKLEPIGTFFRSDRAEIGGIYRYPLSSDDTLGLLRRGLALYYGRHPLFDNRFDEKDSNAYYCTELVCFLYQEVVGVDLSEGRRHSLPLYPNLIFCSDVSQNSRLEEIFTFEQ